MYYLSNIAYYINNGQCTACSASGVCLSCNPSNNVQCYQCQQGYYPSTNGACQACATNCQACTSSTYCTIAQSGYYIPLTSSGSLSGSIVQCTSPCASCSDATNCDSCISGYTFKSSYCSQNSHLSMNIVFGPGSNALQSIILSGDSASTQLFKGIQAINTIGTNLHNLSPAGMKGTQTDWRQYLNFVSLTAASINTNINANGGSYTNANTATTDMTNAITTFPSNVASIVSSSVTAVGFTSTD